MALLCMAALNNCRDWQKVLAKVVAKNSHQNHVIKVQNARVQYLVYNIKSGTLLTPREDEISRRVPLKRADQNMLGGKDWANFFNNPENKKGLIKSVIKGRNIFEIPLIINSGENNFTCILITEFYGWKVWGDYNVAQKWFSENQLPPSMANSNETDLKKKASLKQTKRVHK